MIVVDESKSTQQDTQAGPSNPPPPTFEESIDQDHVILEFQPAGAPPAFAPYAAEFVRSKQGHIISHDPHLNEDGQQFLFNYTFLLLTSSNQQEKHSTDSYYHRHRRHRHTSYIAKAHTTRPVHVLSLIQIAMVVSGNAQRAILRLLLISTFQLTLRGIYR